MTRAVLVFVAAALCAGCQVEKKAEPEATVAVSAAEETDVLVGEVTLASPVDAVRQGTCVYWTIWLEAEQECRVQVQLGTGIRLVMKKVDKRACGKSDEKPEGK